MTARYIHAMRYTCNGCNATELGWDDMKPDDWTQGSIRDKAGEEVGVGDYCPKCSKPIASGASGT